ncbi:8-amino-7-oxononanoate synthase [Epibacterium ulvae]|uniref:8-amino-7-oxononanoate synthase n=1 Tax=Epibacterium ulvae TaxID=1156985 RepID=UPI001BFCB876|nr:8-amino-7-oxononanoate synthase [Epibacterium ulvae]MBT8153766.1 8-amino-7-oxononanoate synthase [Epibacterium ulvae]
MAARFARHAQALDRLQERGRLRQLLPRKGQDFASNDYLGLADSDVLRQAAGDAIARGVPVGAGGSRLLRGNADEHQQLEDEAAAFFGTQAALFMGGGFNANMAIFSTLPQQGDLVLFDALIHASAHDGMRLGRAETRSFAHSDVQAAGDAIAAWRNEGGAGRIWIAVEGVYSMDGDIAPVSDLFQLAQQHDAVLVVDEAHSTAVMGDLGRGVAHAVAHHKNVLCLHTCGKGLGVSGALICGARVLVDTLINKARSFIYATAPSPLNAALVRAALREVAENHDLRRRARATVDHAHREAARLCGLSGFQSQIMPVIIGGDKPTMALAHGLQEIGYDIRGIRPPTVPRGTSRLRLSITLNTDAGVISSMFSDLAQLRQDFT